MQSLNQSRGGLLRHSQSIDGRPRRPKGARNDGCGGYSLAHFAIAAFLISAASTPSVADEARPDTKESEAAIAYGVSHADCQEWTDGCVICARGGDAVNCSTPGIACQPSETVCKRPTR